MIDLLEQVQAAEGQSGAAGATVERRKHAFDDDEELDIDNLDI